MVSIINFYTSNVYDFKATGILFIFIAIFMLMFFLMKLKYNIRRPGTITLNTPISISEENIL